MDDIEKIEAWMRGYTPRRHWEEEVKFLLQERDQLRHRIMVLKFENQGLYAKIEMLKEGNNGSDGTGLCGLDAERLANGIARAGDTGAVCGDEGSVRDDDVRG